MLFSDNAKIIGTGAIFKQSSCGEAIVQKRLKTTAVDEEVVNFECARICHQSKQARSCLR